MQKPDGQAFLRIRDPCQDLSVLLVRHKLRVGGDLLWWTPDPGVDSFPFQVEIYAHDLVAQGVRPELGPEPGFILLDRLDVQGPCAEPSLEPLALPEVELDLSRRCEPGSSPGRTPPTSSEAPLCSGYFEA